jgi:hypothetical protein
MGKQGMSSASLDSALYAITIDKMESSKSKAALRPYEEDGWTPTEIRAEINDITNLTFLSRAKNAEIGDNPPWEYLPNETTREMRKAHFIPEDSELWKPENFWDFMIERQRLLAKAMSSLLKSLS